ncbi:DUF5719 family protein [Frankia sp. AiPa1]|uniref:DUF5719 family protein n=1 Tax=Frankia sp. AiPa1 TaxID=573492 RepID=UPI00202AC8AA|nr:DUF5719 family protein [Frankia sp. AiPa1]MCL9757664.1 DUF5719 family protein [Frankia sp. AiPa1]
MGRIAARTVIPLAVVGLGGAFLVDEGADPSAPARVPITAARIACPDPTLVQPGAHSPLLPGSARLDVVLGGALDGHVRVSPATSGGVPVPVQRGEGWLRLAPQERGGTGARTVSGRDASAAGLSAMVTVGGDGAGPALVGCTPPRARTWFAGPSTMAGRDPLIVLANLAGVPAQATVRVLTDGPVGPTQNITVAAGHAVVRRLAALAPEAAMTAVDVQVRTGRLLAWMVDRSSTGGPFTAPRLVPATAPPARRLVLGGLVVPPGPPVPDTVLVLAAPGRSATVRVSVLTPAGPHTPPGFAAVRVPAAGTISVPVPLPVGLASAVLVESVGSASGSASGAGSVPGSEIGPAAGAGEVGGLGLGEPVLAELGVASGWTGVRTWAGATRIEPSSGRQGLDGYGRGVGLTDPDGPAGGAGTAPDAVVTVPPVPAGAAGALVLTAPLGPVTSRVDGNPVRLEAGTVAVVSQRSRPPAGRLEATGGPLVATVIAGAMPSADGPPADGPPSASARLGRLPVLPRILSAVVPLRGAPRLLDAPSAVADPVLPYR